jgi:hypothetical protein
MTNDKDPYLLIETVQTGDTFHRTSVNDTLRVCLLSVRSQEAQTQKLANQDYARVHIQSDGSSLCFCVCDGVGSSYRGDFAAHYLAKRLIQWMQTLVDLQVQTSTLASQLDAQLNFWARAAQGQLRQVAISPNAPALVREVLEELRDTYGSETVFLCGRIDLDTTSASSGAQNSEGACSAQMLVCWMGNVTAQLLVGANGVLETGRNSGSKAKVSGRPKAGACKGGGKPRPYSPLLARYITLGGDDDRVARWSTLRGARGPVTIWKRHLSTIDRLIVHTDGLDAIVLPLDKLDDKAWQAQMQRLLLQPGHDDMTILELRWQGLVDGKAGVC